MSTPATELGFSYEYAIDINLGTAEAPTWQQIRFCSAIDPQVTSIEQDGATYDDNGAPHPIKVGESWTLGCTVQAQRQADGSYLPELEKLLEHAGPESVGKAAAAHVRWYDDPVDQNPNPNEAYEGHGTVTVTRAQTGNDQIGSWGITITGQGRRKRIPNPSTATAAGGAPVILGATPDEAGAGDLVTITGSGLTGVTSVVFGAEPAAQFVVVSPSTIIAELPADSAGEISIVVTHPVNGASAPFTYTRTV